MSTHVQKILRFCLLAVVSLGLWLAFNQLGQPSSAQSANNATPVSPTLVPPLMPPPGAVQGRGKKGVAFTMPTLVKDSRHSITMPILVKSNTPPPMPQDIRVVQPLAPLPLPRQ
jgi:hypothetical protein